MNSSVGSWSMPSRGLVGCSEEQNVKFSGFCELAATGHGSNTDAMGSNNATPAPPPEPADKEVPAHLSSTLPLCAGPGHPGEGRMTTFLRPPVRLPSSPILTYKRVMENFEFGPNS